MNLADPTEVRALLGAVRDQAREYQELIREYKAVVGKKKSLFESTSSRIRLRLHDTRATFLTLSLANGKTDVWISLAEGKEMNATTQGRKGAKIQRNFIFFASLRLCVFAFILSRHPRPNL